MKVMRTAPLVAASVATGTSLAVAGLVYLGVSLSGGTSGTVASGAISTGGDSKGAPAAAAGAGLPVLLATGLYLFHRRRSKVGD
jgi:LPXTG-motif cell wall-anchored protein